MKPRTTVWSLDDHSKGKHEVLSYYLEAWFPILGSRHPRVTFVDGFAGPGRYQGGEPGSPVIALEAFRRHLARVPDWKGEGVFLFIEADKKRALHLVDVVEALGPPASCRYRVIQSEFADAVDETMAELPAGRPAFVMLDPFGVSGVPMSLVARLLQTGKTEVFASFMYEHINRFGSTPEFDKRVTERYGTDSWKAGVDLAGGAQKREFFFDLYEQQLRGAGASQVVRFDLFRHGHLVYALFFASKYWKGADVMKQAIWKVAPLGDFQYHAARSGQMRLLDIAASDRQKVLRDRFRNKGWVTIDAIEEFFGSDKTDYPTTQLKTDTLVPMEEAGLIEIDPTSRKRRLKYPAGTRIRFP